jgi:hypothetical protein
MHQQERSQEQPRAQQQLRTQEEPRTREVALAARRLAREDEVSLRVLTQLWDAAFNAGCLAALEEFQTRFCVGMD